MEDSDALRIYNTTTTPFTVEAWLRPFSSTILGAIFNKQYVGNAVDAQLIVGLTSGTSLTSNGAYPAFGYYRSATQTFVAAAVSTVAISPLEWTHVACVFTGSTSRVYINGINRTKASSPVPATAWLSSIATGDRWYVGARYDLTSYFDGDIKDLRYVKGTAVYTSDFTPPSTTLLPITNTALLTCNNYRNTQFAAFDNSSNGATITNINDVLVRDNVIPNTNTLGHGTIASEEFNDSASFNNEKGRWSSLQIGPNY